MTFDLIKQYQANPNQENSKLVLDAHAPFIKSQTNKWKGILPDIVMDTKAKHFALEAFKTFDPSKANINTHLYNHLSQLSRLVYTHQNVSQIPEHQIRLIGQVDYAKNFLKDEYGREPVAHEIADYLSIPVAHINKVLENNRKDLLFDSDHEQFGNVTTAKNQMFERLMSLQTHLPEKQKNQLNDLVGINQDPLPLKEFGKKYKMKPYEVSRLKTYFANKISE